MLVDSAKRPIVTKGAEKGNILETVGRNQGRVQEELSACWGFRDRVEIIVNADSNDKLSAPAHVTLRHHHLFNILFLV